jgi:hypothetical protein
MMELDGQLPSAELPNVSIDVCDAFFLSSSSLVAFIFFFSTPQENAEKLECPVCWGEYPAPKMKVTKELF